MSADRQTFNRLRIDQVSLVNENLAGAATNGLVTMRAAIKRERSGGGPDNLEPITVRLHVRINNSSARAITRCSTSNSGPDSLIIGGGLANPSSSVLGSVHCSNISFQPGYQQDEVVFVGNVMYPFGVTGSWGGVECVLCQPQLCCRRWICLYGFWRLDWSRFFRENLLDRIPYPIIKTLDFTNKLESRMLSAWLFGNFVQKSLYDFLNSLHVKGLFDVVIGSNFKPPLDVFIRDLG